MARYPVYTVYIVGPEGRWINLAQFGLLRDARARYRAERESSERVCLTRLTLNDPEDLLAGSDELFRRSGSRWRDCRKGGK